MFDILHGPPNQTATISYEARRLSPLQVSRRVRICMPCIRLSRGASPHCISLGVNYSSLYQTRVRVKHLSLDINGAVPDGSFFFFPYPFIPNLSLCCGVCSVATQPLVRQ